MKARQLDDEEAEYQEPQSMEEWLAAHPETPEEAEQREKRELLEKAARQAKTTGKTALNQTVKKGNIWDIDPAA